MKPRHRLRLARARRLGILIFALLLALSLSGQNAPPEAPPDGSPDSAPTAPAKPLVYMLPIEGPINQLTQQSLQRMVDKATEAGAAAIVFDLDTPGGQVGAALDICDMIKAQSTRTTAWVNPRAYSAGSMISVACDGIVITENARIGDSAPILVGPQGLQNIGETERAKIESPILAEFRDSAKRNGYPLALSEAMVTLGPPIYRIVNDKTDQRQYVWADELYKFGLEAPGPQQWRDRAERKKEREREDEDKPEESPQRPSTPLPGMSAPAGATAGLADAASSASDKPDDEDAPAEGDAPADDDPANDDPADGDDESRGAADDAAPSAADAAEATGPDAAEAPAETAHPSDPSNADNANSAQTAEQPTEDGGAWRIEKQVLEAKTLLTMLTDEAIEYSFAKAEVNNETELLEHLGLPDAEIRRLSSNWSEDLVAWLTSPFIQGLLTIVLLMGLYSEMQAPGLGLAGGIAIVAAAILLGAPYLAGLAQTWEILIIVAGLILLAVEVFVIPGFGVAGISGMVLMFAGMVLIFVPEEPGPGFLPTLPGTWDALGTSVLTVLIAGILSLVGIALLTRYFGNIPVLNRLVLQEDQTRQTAAAPSTTSAGVGGSGGGESAGVAVGDEGRAMGDLRPVGRAEINGQVLDVITASSWIEHGQKLRITEIRGNRIEVAPA